MRFITLIISILIASPSHALFNSDSFRLAHTGTVHVQLNDDAKNGCWTNLRETREYAEEKLRSKGAKLSSEIRYGAHDYLFEVGVIAYRTRGGCVAAISIKLTSFTFLPNLNDQKVYHIAEVGFSNRLISGYPKANEAVLDYVKEFIDNLK